MDFVEARRRVREAVRIIRGHPATVTEREVRPYFVRIIDQSSANAWFEPAPSPDRILQKVFDQKKHRPQSTYICRTSQDELEAAAAHELLHDSERIGKSFILRIEESDIVAAGIKVESPGECTPTGVSSVDERHADLHASRRQLVQLIELLMREHESGREIIRRIWIRQTIWQMKHFLTLPDGLVAPDSKTRCRMKTGA